MTDILRLYQSGLSVRGVAKSLGMGDKAVRAALHDAGAIRTKSEGMYLRYNPMAIPTRPDPNDCLTLTIGDPKKPWAIIKSPYSRPVWFTGVR